MCRVKSGDGNNAKSLADLFAEEMIAEKGVKDSIFFGA